MGLRFGVLGPIAVWTSDGDPVAVPERKVRTLLAALLVHGGRPVPAARLIDDLWGDDRPSDPAAALRTKVSQLRKALESGAPGGRDLVVHRRPGYALEIDEDAVDAHRFSRLVTQAGRVTDLPTRVDLLTEALGLWRGPVLADLGDVSMTLAVPSRWTEQRLTALEDLAEARLETGGHQALVAELPELIGAHPLRERLWSIHIRALYRAGRQGEALQTHRDLRTRLADELGVDPAPELAALYPAMLRQDPALDPPPPLLDRDGRRGNLPPAPLTRLVGRDGAVEEVLARLDAGRLVTLAGSGGVGKTRLALEVGSRLADHLPGGVWLVEMPGLTDAGEVTAARDETTEADLAYAVANALGLREPSLAALGDSQDGGSHADGYGAVDRLIQAVTERECLIVLDNCEHVLVPAARLTSRLLLAAPGLRVLATSREPLRIAGETVWQTQPLTLPPPDSAHGADPLTVGESAAVQLFVDRAAAAAPDFVLDAATAPAVATICRRLDGLPLALELAATRVRALGVQQLAARLDDRFRVLGRGSRIGAARHQTLEAMIDWSWQLLTPAQQALLRRTALSADGYDLEAIESICVGDGVAATDLLDLLTDLVDRSLVVVDTEHRPRYHVLESVAAFCLERHPEGELRALRERHDTYFTEVAEQSRTGLRGPSQLQWLERLDLESNNIRLALDGGIQRSDGDHALRVAIAMTWYWFLRGRFRDGARALARALAVGAGSRIARAEAAALRAGFARWVDGAARPEESLAETLSRFDGLDETGARARAQWFLTLTGFGMNHAADGDQLVEDALAAFVELGDRWGEAASLALRASRALVVRGEMAGTRRDADRAVQLFRALGDRWGEMQGLQVLDQLAEIGGDYAAARSLASGMVHIAAVLDSPGAASYAWSRLGRLSLLTGDHHSADDYHRQAAQIAVQHGDWVAESFAEVGLALSARRTGRLDDAETYLARWTQRLRAQGNQSSVAFLLTELGFVAAGKGDAELALTRQLEGSTAAFASGEPRSIALSFEGLAGALRAGGRASEAARCLGAANSARASISAPLPAAERGDVDRTGRELLAVLGRESLERELARGSRADHRALLDEVRYSASGAE